MSTSDADPCRFLVEWYTPILRHRSITDVARRLRDSLASMPSEPRPPELLVAVEIPRDAYAFGLFAATSADLVARACQQAGMPADRVTPAIEATAFGDQPA
jgi:hypothetical protein